MKEQEFFFARDYAVRLRNFSWRPYHAHKVLPAVCAETLEERLTRLEALHARSRYLDSGYIASIITSLFSGYPPVFTDLALSLLPHNSILFEFPRLPNVSLTQAQAVEVHRVLSEIELRLQHEEEIVNHYFARLLEFADTLRPLFENETTLSMSITDPAVFEQIIGYFCQDADHPVKSLAFSGTVETLFENFLKASNLTPQLYDERKHRLVQPSDYEGDPHDYVRGTGLEPFFEAKLPFKIRRSAWLEHAFIAAPSGHGKTQLLQALIYDFLREDPPGMFIIDSQGSMLKLIKRVYPDAILLTPKQVQLNLFQLGDGTDANLNDLFSYLFAAIDASLTGKQATVIPYLLRLMKKLPNPSFKTLRDVMESKAGAFAPYISQLDPLSQSFFANQFYQPVMKATRDQISWRLYSILGNDVFANMFSGERNDFDPDRHLQEGKIVLLDTSESELGIDGSAILGRFYIAQILAAAYRRPEHRRPMSLLVVDEAAAYFDRMTEMILARARKFGLGGVWATQFLEQIPSSVKSAIFGNTSIKFAGPVSIPDAMMLGREMYSDGDFLRSMRFHEKVKTEFACYVKGQTETAVRVTVPFLIMERASKEKAGAIEDATAFSPSEGSSPSTTIIPETHEPPPDDEGSRDKAGMPPEADTTIIPDENDPSKPVPVDGGTKK